MLQTWYKYGIAELLSKPQLIRAHSSPLFTTLYYDNVYILHDLIHMYTTKYGKEQASTLMTINATPDLKLLM